MRYFYSIYFYSIEREDRDCADSKYFKCDLLKDVYAHTNTL